MKKIIITTYMTDAQYEQLSDLLSETRVADLVLNLPPDETTLHAVQGTRYDQINLPRAILRGRRDEGYFGNLEISHASYEDIATGDVGDLT